MIINKQTSFYFLVYLMFGASVAEDLILNLNKEKPIAVTSDKFLSLTLDPAVLFKSDVFK